MTYHVETLMASNDRMMDEGADAVLYGVFNEAGNIIIAYPREGDADAFAAAMNDDSTYDEDEEES